MKIGFIGLGSMGWPMSLCLVRDKHELTVLDIDSDCPGAKDLLQAGATWADTPKEVAQGSEIIFTSLPGAPEVEAVALGKDGILDGAAEGSVYVDLSTNSPTLMRRIHRIYQEKGVHVLDSPVAEAVDRAKYEGTLTLMVGGDREVFERVEPVLRSIGRDRLFYAGESGSGAVCKLVNNHLVYANHVSLAEAVTLGRLAGVSAEILATAISNGTGQSLLGDDFKNNLSAQGSGIRDSGFPLWIGRKDIRLATDLGRELDVPLDIGNYIEQRFTEWMAQESPTKPINVQNMIEETLSKRAKTKG